MGRAKLDSDEEMSASPPPKSSKGRQSAGGSSKKKRELSPASSEEDEVDYDLEDIRDVAWQVNPKTGKDIRGKWQYFVKWLNYPESENSWVIEEDFNDKEMIAKFWARHEDHDLHPDLFIKPAVKGRKSNASAAPRSSLSNSKSRSKAKDEDSDDDASSKPVSKRKSSSKDHDEDDIVEATPETDQEVEERPKKKSKKAPVKKKSEEVEENGFLSDAETPTAGAGHDLNAMQRHMHKKNWEQLIETIETVERSDDDLYMVYFTATDGSKAICSSEVLADKAPKKLIKFYEAHLRWRGPSQNEK